MQPRIWEFQADKRSIETRLSSFGQNEKGRDSLISRSFCSVRGFFTDHERRWLHGRTGQKIPQSVSAKFEGGENRCRLQSKKRRLVDRCVAGRGGWGSEGGGAAIALLSVQPARLFYH